MVKLSIWDIQYAPREQYVKKYYPKIASWMKGKPLIKKIQMIDLLQKKGIFGEE